MKIKDRIKSTGFWTGLIGAVFLIMSAFGVEIGDQTAGTVINSVCSLLVLFGIVKVPTSAVSDDAVDSPTDDSADEEK